MAGRTFFFLGSPGEGVLAPQALRAEAQPLSPDRPLQEERVWVSPQPGVKASEEPTLEQMVKAPVECL